MTSIGIYAFQDCYSLTSIEIPNGLTSIVTGTFYGCSSITYVEIPDGVTSIESSAFSDCTSLTSIEIPNCVTSIEGSAFADCSSLTSVVCYAENVPAISSSAFYRVTTSEATLYVPASAIEDYKTADYWKDFGTILPLEEIPTSVSSIETQGEESDAVYYTLNGIRVSNPAKGIYIKNGKKVLIK